MKKQGTIALEALIASGLVLLLLIVLTGLFSVFWQSWHETTEDNHQRQWAALAFEHLDRDIREASRVRAGSSTISVTLPGGTFEYRVSNNQDSFHRRLGTSYFALAPVESATWWWEGELLWVELNFPRESYRCCFYIPEEKR